MADTMSVAVLLRQRKKLKMTRKLGINADALWHMKSPKPSPLSPSAAKIDFEMAKRQFTLTNSPSSNVIPEIQTPEPEEVEVKRQKEQPNSSPATSNEQPVQNVFFQLPLPRKVTDEEAYEEFKRSYILQGIEQALWRRRKYQKRTKRSKKGNRSR